MGLVVIVGMKEDSKHDDVHEQFLGKSEGFAYKAGQSLAQGEVESLNVVGLTFPLGAGLMLFSLQHLLISV